MNHHLLKQVIKLLVKEQYIVNKTMFSGTLVDSLTEARIDDVKKKYPEVAVQIDMFSDQEYQKYISWIAKQLKAKYEVHGGLSTVRVVDRIKTSISNFNKGIKLGWVTNNDIESYKTLEDLEESVEGLPQHSKTDLKKQAKKSSKLIYKGDRFTVIKPESMEASCYYGFGTKWCISATQSENYYKSYADRGIEFYFIMDKLPTNKAFNKLAVAVYPNSKDVEFFDSADNPVTIEQFIEYYPQEIITVLTPFVKKLKTIEDRSEEFLKTAEGMDGKAFKQLLNHFYQNFADSDEMGNDDYGLMMTKIIDKIPLTLLPYLYYPDARGSLTLNNVGVLSNFADRLKKENLSIEKVLNMAKVSHQTYYIDLEYWSTTDPYYEYFDLLPKATLEDIKKLSFTNTNPKTFEKPPFYQIAVNLYLIHIAPSLGIDVNAANKYGFDEISVLRYFATSEKTQEYIKNIAEALKSQDQKKLDSLSFDHARRSSSIPFPVFKKIAGLYSSGALTPEFLAPIISNQ